MRNYVLGVEVGRTTQECLLNKGWDTIILDQGDKV